MVRKLQIALGVMALLLGTLALRFVTTANAATDQAASLEKSCDYGCLTGFVDQYLQALIAHDPSRISVADHVKFTENTIPLKLGDALWGTMSGLGTYKLYFADPHDGEVGFEGSIRENGTPAILLLRLRVVDRKIAEIEALVHRNGDDTAALEKRGQPSAPWLQPLEASQKMSRESMVKTANLYFEGITHSSGDMVPFDPQCNRVLDGFQDTNNPTTKGWFDKESFRPDAMSIRENMNTGVWIYIHSIDPRRFMVIDEKMGIVLAMVMYNHPGNIKSAEVRGVGTVPMPPVALHPSTLAAGEFFKLQGGRIREVEGVTVGLPYGSHMGW